MPAAGLGQPGAFKHGESLDPPVHKDQLRVLSFKKGMASFAKGDYDIGTAPPHYTNWALLEMHAHGKKGPPFPPSPSVPWFMAPWQRGIGTKETESPVSALLSFSAGR